MKIYNSKEKFEIIGRGTVFAMEQVKEEEIQEIGEEVEIDGQIYKVRGIEMFRKMIPQAKNNIGILV